MFSLLFHKDVFLPKDAKNSAIILNQKMTNYFLSKHFKEHLDNQENENRSHKYFRNVVFNCLNEMCSKYRKLLEPFEIELSKDYNFFGVSSWFVTKYCVRIQYDTTSDLVVVIRPQWDKEKKEFDVSRNMIVTAWINHKDDAHSTLDESKYCSKDYWEKCNK